MTDANGAFSVPVTITGTGVTAGSSIIVAAGMLPTAVVRYRASTVNVTAATVASLSRPAVSRVAGTVADLRSRRTLVRAAR
jgi:predicted aconitase with swiveling domain